MGISRTATLSEIKSAYRTLALKYHPDVNKADDAHERFIEINEAYELLADFSKRELFDKLYDSFINPQNQNLAEQEKQVMNAQYRDWKEEAKERGEVHARMSFADYKYSILDKLVAIYDSTKLIIKVIFSVLLLWYFFGGFTCFH